MRNKRRTDEEWLSLIQQCRSSGFSDRVWCEQNDMQKTSVHWLWRIMVAR